MENFQLTLISKLTLVLNLILKLLITITVGHLSLNFEYPRIDLRLKLVDMKENQGRKEYVNDVIIIKSKTKYTFS